MQYKNISAVKNFKGFLQGGHILLTQTLGNFFSASVKLYYEPLRELIPAYNVDIMTCVNRSVYILDADVVLLISHLNVNETSYLLGIVIDGHGIGEFNGKKIFTSVAASISNALQDSLKSKFRGSVIFFNENLITRIVSKYVSAGSYNSYKINYYIQKFNALRTTTFEGKSFSTGLIVTKSLYNYKNQREKNCAVGSLLKLRSPRHIYEDINTRFWYLIDGHSAFYLSNLKGTIPYIFEYKDQMSYDVHRFSSSGAIMGRDIMLRTESGRELSIITSKGIEFIYQENTWRYRDYKWLEKQIDKVIHLHSGLFDAIMHYILYCSKNDISSILWIPSSTDVKEIDKYISSKHSHFYSSIKIQDPDSEGIFKRFLSSDGATTINSEGKLLYYGCIANLTAEQSNNPKGTGETAASILAKNGVVFKVSQDGTIKIFFGPNHIKF